MDTSMQCGEKKIIEWSENCVHKKSVVRRCWAALSMVSPYADSTGKL